MKYLVIDAALHGTGIRDYYGGGYINPESLNVNSELMKKLNDWLLRYEDEHYNGFLNNNLIEELDFEGKEIARALKEELLDAKIDYFSAAKMIKEHIV